VFGIVGRLVITAVVVAIGIGLRAASVAWTDAVGPAGGALAFVLLGCWAIAAVVVLVSAWRPGRGTRIVRVEGPLVPAAPVRRRADGARVPRR
jgi:hypothetical protein